MGRWYVSEQSIFDEETGEEIIEAAEWYMRGNLKRICDEHNKFIEFESKKEGV